MHLAEPLVQAGFRRRPRTGLTVAKMKDAFPPVQQAASAHEDAALVASSGEDNLVEGDESHRGVGHYHKEIEKLRSLGLDEQEIQEALDGLISAYAM